MNLVTYSFPIFFLFFIELGLIQVHTSKFVVNPPFPFFGKSYDAFFLNDQGTITTKSQLKDDEPGPTCEATARDFASISPYWIKVVKRSPEIALWFYTDKKFESVQSAIANAFPAFHDFKMKWLCKTGWENMTVFDHKWDQAHFTIEVQLVTDGVRSFAIFEYEEMLYSQNTSVPYFSGFDSGDGQKRHLIAANCRNTRKTKLNEDSNVGIPGKWVFRVDKETIYEPGSLCPAPPTPSDGYCHILDDYTVGSVAVCGCYKSVKYNSERIAKCEKCKDESKVRCVQMNNGTLIWAGSPPECEASNVTRTTYYPMVTENPFSTGPIYSINILLLFISSISIMSMFYNYH